MNIFGIHFCHEEALAVLAALPFMGVAVHRMRAWFHKRKKCQHEDGWEVIDR